MVGNSTLWLKGFRLYDRKATESRECDCSSACQSGSRSAFWLTTRRISGKAKNVQTDGNGLFLCRKSAEMERFAA